MDTISPLISVPRVGAVSSQGGNKGQSQHLPQPGQLIKAKVVEAQPNNIFQLEIGDRLISARTEAKLTPGQELQLQVLKTSPQIELKVVTDTLNKVLGRSLSLIGKDLDISQLITQLKTSSNLSRLSSNSKQVLESFHSLQQSAQPKLTATDHITKFVAQFSKTLQNSIAAQTSQQPAQPQIQLQSQQPIHQAQLQPAAIQEAAARLTTLFNTVPNITSAFEQFSQELTPPQREIISQLVLLQTKGDNSPEMQKISENLFQALGIPTEAAISASTITTGASNLQNAVFAFLHLIKNSGSEQQQFPQQGESSSGQSSLDDKNGGRMLRQLIDNLGLKLESLLSQGQSKSASSTLKSALLELGAQFKNSQNIAEATNRILTTLELFQLAQLHLQGDKQLIYPLPLPFLEQGYLVIDNEPTPGRDNQNNSNLSFSLHLALKELGNIQVDFHSLTDGLYLRVRMENEEKAEFISQFKDELNNALSVIQLKGLSFSGDAEDPAGMLIKRFLPEGMSMLDTKA